MLGHTICFLVLFEKHIKKEEKKRTRWDRKTFHPGLIDLVRMQVCRCSKRTQWRLLSRYPSATAKAHAVVISNACVSRPCNFLLMADHMAAWHIVKCSHPNIHTLLYFFCCLTWQQKRGRFLGKLFSFSLIDFKFFPVSASGGKSVQISSLTA